MTQYEPGASMREARARYFDENGFGGDGGYNDAWVDFKLGSIPFPFPNTPGRVRAVRYHDLHHVLTGYKTDFPGELEISGWEIGAGCKGFLTAWQLNLGGMAAGVFFMPKKTFAAFVRGRRSASLYGLPFEPLLEWTVSEARDKMHVPADPPKPNAGDYALFGAATVCGLVIGLATFAVSVPLLPLAYLAFSRKARAARRTPRPA